ncbi:unnamed protein product [Prorocentrum cordatum]|uniref:Uncharacterized protein n=1 Tax=Prorocentrum cordatum TaxID=2364126 RepID=A0ABN9XM29_9DINO|nr:unnamed protein product [Polarella glacialis]
MVQNNSAITKRRLCSREPGPEEAAAMVHTVSYNAEFVAALLASAKEAVGKNLGDGAAQRNSNNMQDLIERMGPSKVSALLMDDPVRAKPPVIPCAPPASCFCCPPLCSPPNVRPAWQRVRAPTQNRALPP